MNILLSIDIQIMFVFLKKSFKLLFQKHIPTTVLNALPSKLSDIQNIIPNIVQNIASIIVPNEVSTTVPKVSPTIRVPNLVSTTVHNS